MNETGPAEIHQASTGVHNVKFHIRIPLLTKDAFLDPGLGLLAIDMPKYNVISSDLNHSSLAEQDVPRSGGMVFLETTEWDNQYVVYAVFIPKNNPW